MLIRLNAFVKEKGKITNWDSMVSWGEIQFLAVDLNSRNMAGSSLFEI